MIVCCFISGSDFGHDGLGAAIALVWKGPVPPEDEARTTQSKNDGSVGGVDLCVVERCCAGAD